MRPHSLLRRVLLRLALVTGVTLVATLGLLLWQFETATGVIVDAALPETLAEVSAALSLDPSGTPVVSLPAERLARFHEEFFFTVSDDVGHAFLSVPEGRVHAYHPFEPEQIERPQYFEHRFTESDHSYLGVTARVVLEGREFWVQVVEEVPYWRTLAHYSIELFVEGVAVLVILHLLVTAGLSYLTVRASLAPVRAAAAEARRIGPGREEIRLSPDGLPEEVVPLAEAVNGALDRLASAIAAQKRLTADAAHEILTPLAVLRAEAEALEDTQAAAGILAEIDGMAEMARQLLELAELDALSELPGDACDLGRIAEEVLARHAAAAIAAGMEPRLVAPDRPVILHGCAKGLRSALGNLVANAIQHGHGASFVEIAIGPPGRIRVADDGPGVPEAERTRIFERFYRRGQGHGGNRGLGLAIVRRIVEAHRGSIVVQEGPGGRGAVFAIDLPAAPPPRPH